MAVNVGRYTSRAAKDAHNRDDNAKMDPGKNKDRLRNEKFSSDAMVKRITTYVTQKRFSWYCHVPRRGDMNVAKQVTTMKVGGKIPRGRPRLRWMDRVLSNLKQHQLDAKLAQNREARRKAIMAIDPGQGHDRQGKGNGYIYIYIYIYRYIYIYIYIYIYLYGSSISSPIGGLKRSIWCPVVFRHQYWWVPKA